MLWSCRREGVCRGHPSSPDDDGRFLRCIPPGEAGSYLCVLTVRGIYVMMGAVSPRVRDEILTGTGV
jgi:hypothetical protein